MRNSASIVSGLILIGVGLSFITIFLFSETTKPALEPALSQLPSPTPEPLIPTRTRTSPIAPAVGSVPVTPVVTPTAWQATRVPPSPWQGKPRWGIGAASAPITRYDVSAFSFGWYLDWNARRDPPKPAGIEYAQMPRVQGGVLNPPRAVIAEIARAHPGSLWLIGNEPDVKWQDNVEPRTYARLYHEAYTAIKSADPTAQVAIGGVTQPTPLRLRYLDQVLAAHREQFGAEIPIDLWNVHNFILREERGSWGVEIPPGMSDPRGMLYEVDDSGSLDLFRKQILDFRRWMAARGYQNRALIVSEYGIPMPEDYGFPPERVADFLIGTFDFFLTATDPALGDPSDDYKLVQRWCWYSLDDSGYPTGRLFDPTTGALTRFGAQMQKYISGK